MSTISIGEPYGLLIEIQEAFIKHANCFRQFVNQNSNSTNDAKFSGFYFDIFSILSVEPPILAAFQRNDNTEWLHLAIIRFNMQAATYEFLREPFTVRVDVSRFIKCKVVDNLFCVLQPNQPAYFASYKFDEHW